MYHNHDNAMPSPSNEKPPVLLVHGIWKTQATFLSMSRYLAARGFTVHALDLVPNDGRAPLESLALQISAYADATFPPDAPFDLVGFSMGGLVSRYYVQRLRGIERVRRLITISSPHHGTRWAHVRNLPGYLQMRPESPFLKDLNSDVSMLSKINFTSIWTPLDMMILPAHSSRLPVGDEILVSAPLHAFMLRDPRSLEAVAQTLSAPLRKGSH